MGDSITLGIGDDDSSDNFSADGRTVSRGYEPILNDLLTSYHDGYPHMIANEGVGGTISADGVTYISTLLGRHERAIRFLVQYGTNDANRFLAIPSGKGLVPGDSGYPGTFKYNMQKIIDAINVSNKTVCLAKPPIVLGDTVSGVKYTNIENGFRNVLIREYIDVIDELIADVGNNINCETPDFYNYFNSVDPVTGNKRYVDQYFDNFHPNGVGYNSMAEIWFQVLTGGAP
jgi:lysophospholipase L1-like esterase